jgi:anti-sigma-K factor RskA
VAAAVCLVVGVVAGVLIERSPATQGTELADVLAHSDVRMVPLAGAGPTGAKVVWSAQAGRAVVVANGMAQLPDDQTMELWRIQGARATEVGLFQPDGEGRVRASFAVDLRDADALGVTIEPEGGSKRPTLPIVMQGAVS